jgi:hypothetical protein
MSGRIDVDIDRLRRIANMAGAPTMQYAPETAIEEQRRTLNAIAAEVGMILREATAVTVVTVGPTDPIVFGLHLNQPPLLPDVAKGEII